MRFCSFYLDNQRTAGILFKENIISILEINQYFGTAFPPTLEDIISQGYSISIEECFLKIPTTKLRGKPVTKFQLKAPYKYPQKILGIGLNFLDHAADLKASCPNEEPASFFKPSTTIIGPGEPVILPPQSARVTGEAELGVIIGQECRNLSIDNVDSAIFGYTTIIDMTAEDILQKNPRYLTRAKSFDTFFSFGPWIVTPDEFEDLSKLKITTSLNGKKHRTNTVTNMTFSPDFLVAFHSKVMTLKPGDIISCGTPGAVRIQPGDCVGCEVDGIGYLENPVLMHE